MNDEARTGVKGAGNPVLIRASSSIRHSTFVIRHFEPRCK